MLITIEGKLNCQHLMLMSISPLLTSRCWFEKYCTYLMCQFMRDHYCHPLLVSGWWLFCIVQKGTHEVGHQAPVFHCTSRKVRNGNVIWITRDDFTHISFIQILFQFNSLTFFFKIIMTIKRFAWHSWMKAHHGMHCYSMGLVALQKPGFSISVLYLSLTTITNINIILNWIPIVI